MTLADSGARTYVNDALVDEFRAFVARIGIMNAVSGLFDDFILENGLTFPGKAFTLHHEVVDVGGPQWLIVAGSSSVPRGVHLQGAPAWARERLGSDEQPAMVVWGKPGSWNTSPERRDYEDDGTLPIVDVERPWMTEGIRDDIAPALTDVATRNHFQYLLPTDEPDVLAAANFNMLAPSIWNALVCPAVVTNKQRLAASLRSLAAHVHLQPIEAKKITAVVNLIEKLWFTYVPGQPKPLTEVPGSIDIPPRTPIIERDLTSQNTAFVWGWAITAMSQAAKAIPVRERTAHFDQSGLLIRDGSAWARLVGLDAGRLAMVGEGATEHIPTRQYFTRPSWVPGLHEKFGGSEAWTVRGFWRGCNATGPIENISYLSAAAKVKPNRAANLPAALAVVPDPVTAEARIEVTEMMQGLQDFTWNNSVLATRPGYGTTPASYPF